jgi:hypothetical protein
MEVSGSLLVGYSKNPAKFQINRWAQNIPVTKSAFYYANWNSQEAARVRNNYMYKWADGHMAPSGNDETEAFDFVLAETNRYAFPFSIGRKAVVQASFDLLAAQSASTAQKAMTNRCLDVYNTLANAGLTSATATSLGGGTFDVGTPTSPFARVGLWKAAQAINLATLGVVNPSDLVLIMNPYTSSKIAASQEITDYLKLFAGPSALAGQGAPLPGSGFGLDGMYLFGFEVIVDQTVYTTAAKGAATTTMQYVIPNSVIYMVSRAGGLTGVEGSPSFSTIQIAFYEEFTFESKDDPDNRITQARIVTDYIPIISDQGKKSGYVITAATT